MISIACTGFACSATTPPGPSPGPQLVTPALPNLPEPQPPPTTSRDVLAVGARHGCAVHSGQVLCWGDNARDQLGDPRVGAATVPIEGPIIPGIVGLAAGGTATCALLQTGQVSCWGDDKPGVRTLPDVADGVEVSVASYRDHSRRCVRRRSGRVQCWPGPGDDVASQELPIRHAIALTGSCAIDRDGTQTCYAPAPLSDRVPTPRVASARMAREPIGYRPAPGQVAAARRAARQYVRLPCLLRGDKTVGCWSNDAETPRINHKPAADGLLTVVGLDGAGQIAAGHDFVCAVRTDNTVRCTTSPYGATQAIADPRGLDRIHDAIQVVAGEAHACARRASGAVVCWGGNEAGQLGSGSLEPRDDVVEVPQVRAVALAAGSFHTCALTAAGTLWCWGLGEQGQLGDAITPRWSRDFPTVVAGLPPIADLALLPAQSCARGVDGTLWCWGQGGLFVGETAPRCRPDGKGGIACRPWGGGGSACGRRFASQLGQAQPRRIGDGRIRDVVGFGHALLQLDDRGQIAVVDPHRSCSEHPRESRDARRILATVTDAVQIAGTALMCLRTSAGQVRCTEHDVAAATTPQRDDVMSWNIIAGIDDAVDIAAGFAHACALHRDGTVSCWGQNPSGQLGDGTANRSTALVRVQGLDHVVDIAAGWFHTCALRSDNTLWCWGENTGGALGDATTIDRPHPVRVSGLGQVRAFAAVDWRSCAWDAEGPVYCWGARPEGEFEPLPRPRQVVMPPAD